MRTLDTLALFSLLRRVKENKMKLTRFGMCTLLFSQTSMGEVP
jgi:hypothetical protein